MFEFLVQILSNIDFSANNKDRKLIFRPQINVVRFFGNFLCYISKKTGLEPAVFDVTGRRFNRIKLQFHYGINRKILLVNNKFKFTPFYNIY